MAAAKQEAEITLEPWKTAKRFRRLYPNIFDHARLLHETESLTDIARLNQRWPTTEIQDGGQQNREYYR